jgi:hypothetical protein
VITTKSSAARAADQIEQWTGFYTRGLPPEVADARRVEIASDLYEQLNHFAHQGISDRVIARAVRSRALRGAIADLVWRREQVRTAHQPSRPARPGVWLPASLLAVCYALGTGELLAAAFVLVRWSARASRAPYISGSSDLYLVIAGMGLSAFGLWLLRRERSRWVGALWLAASVSMLVDRGFAILVPVSASARFVQELLPGWSIIEWSTVGGIVLFFVGAALWWGPSSRSSERAVGVA